MESSYDQIFLAIAVKNSMLTPSAAAECLSLCAPGGRNAAQVVREKNLLREDQVQLIDAAVGKVRQGQSGTVRIVKTPVPGAPPPRAAAAPANPNEPVPGFNIVGKLGVGGTSTVFLAEDRKNGGRKTALKILKPALAKEEKTLRFFLREAELLVKFRHPNIVPGHCFGTAGPLTYLAMDYLEGETVFDILQRNRALPEARALEILFEAAKALAYLQGEGIIHRDIKPDNLMVTKDGRVVLCDLGFAQPMTPEPDVATREETTSGTVQYMSPEQARGQRDLDIRSDIYSLGATLYHMVMGEVPFQGGDSLEVMAKQVLEALNSSEIKNRGISKHMHYFIERMMSKDKDLRYSSPQELVDDIHEQLEGFRSLQYQPDEAKKSDSVVLRGLKGLRADEAPTRKHAPGTSVTRKVGHKPASTRRFRRPR